LIFASKGRIKKATDYADSKIADWVEQKNQVGDSSQTLEQPMADEGYPWIGCECRKDAFRARSANIGFEKLLSRGFPKNCVCDHLGADAKKTQIIRNRPAVNINRNASSIIAMKPSYAEHPSG
jgi:hypothetical protein